MKDYWRTVWLTLKNLHVAPFSEIIRKSCSFKLRSQSSCTFPIMFKTALGGGKPVTVTKMVITDILMTFYTYSPHSMLRTIP